VFVFVFAYVPAMGLLGLALNICLSAKYIIVSRHRTNSITVAILGGPFHDWV
jgi:hypothetical protein